MLGKKKKKRKDFSHSSFLTNLHVWLWSALLLTHPRLSALHIDHSMPSTYWTLRGGSIWICIISPELFHPTLCTRGIHLSLLFLLLQREIEVCCNGERNKCSGLSMRYSNAAVPCSGSAVILAKGLFLARVNGFSDGCRLHSSLRVLCSTEVVNKAMLSAF